jgi:hypothetical protein
MILFFRNKTGKTTFSQGELSLILGVYGERVKRGEWRDYAIDSLQDMAVFSVFRSSREQPLYSIMKIPGRSFLNPPRYAVYSGAKALKEGTSLSDVLGVFESTT